MKAEDRKFLRLLIASALFAVLAALIGSFVRPSGVYEAPPAVPSTPILIQHAETLRTAATPGPEPSDDFNYPGLPYWFTLMPTGTICFEVRGSYYATQAALDIFYNTDAKILPARSNCVGYPSTNHVRLRGADLGTGACAITTGVAGTGMEQRVVRGMKVWVMQAPEIRFNTNPAVTKACFGNAFAARHVYGHELLHALGLKHNWGIASLVASTPAAGSGLTDYSWDFDRVTSWDRAEINRRY
jgi:hypothetical protein